MSKENHDLDMDFSPELQEKQRRIAHLRAAYEAKSKEHTQAEENGDHKRAGEIEIEIAQLMTEHQMIDPEAKLTSLESAVKKVAEINNTKRALELNEKEHPHGN